MKLIADAFIALPFTIDLCARGPDVDPLACTLNGFQATLFFPPSLGEDTDGQGIFGEWAWWNGPLAAPDDGARAGRCGDSETLRAAALATGTEFCVASSTPTAGASAARRASRCPWTRAR